MATKKLILDLDMGVDDAMALAYAIASPEVELVGITTCFGNVRVEQSAHNCLAVLDLLGRPEVPVYLGADRPIKATEPYTPPASTTLIHGKNGMVWNISSYLLRNSNNALPMMNFWNTKKYTKTVSTEP